MYKLAADKYAVNLAFQAPASEEALRIGNDILIEGNFLAQPETSLLHPHSHRHLVAYRNLLSIACCTSSHKKEGHDGELTQQ